MIRKIKNFLRKVYLLHLENKSTLFVYFILFFTIPNLIERVYEHLYVEADPWVFIFLTVDLAVIWLWINLLHKILTQYTLLELEATHYKKRLLRALKAYHKHLEKLNDPSTLQIRYDLERMFY